MEKQKNVVSAGIKVKNPEQTGYLIFSVSDCFYYNSDSALPNVLYCNCIYQ